jgi:hypothetical protein
MHSRRLQTALTKLIEAAASDLQAEIDGGAEVPFELGSQTGRRGRGATPLYCYRALTGAFIAERETELERLPGYGEAVSLMEGFDGLDRYLVSAGVDDPTRRGRASRRGKGHTGAQAAIIALLSDVFDEQSDFEVHPERVDAALDRLMRSDALATSEVTLVATLHGLTITSAELPVTTGLTIAHPDALQGIPDGARAPDEVERDADHLVVALTVSDDGGAIAKGDAREAIAQAREVLRDLLRALRLFGDGRVALGALAWARVGGGVWSPVALKLSNRP